MLSVHCEFSGKLLEHSISPKLFPIGSFFPQQTLQIQVFPEIHSEMAVLEPITCLLCNDWVNLKLAPRGPIGALGSWSKAWSLLQLLLPNGCCSGPVHQPHSGLLRPPPVLWAAAADLPSPPSPGSSAHSPPQVSVLCLHYSNTGCTSCLPVTIWKPIHSTVILISACCCSC